MTNLSSSDLKVFFIDDDEALRAANQQSLMLAGFNVEDFSSAEASLATIVRGGDLPDVIVCDIRLSGMSGLDLLEEWKTRDIDLPIILITGHGDIEMAVFALKNGAYDFIAKPYDSERLIEAVRRAGEKRRLVLENRQLRRLAQMADNGLPLIGEAPAMERLRQTLRQLADTDAMF